MPFDATNNYDKNLFASYAQEAIKIHGIDLIYLTVQFNDNKEPIYGEDTKPLITGRYKIRGYAELIEEDIILRRFGFGSDDTMRIQIDVKEFNEVLNNTVPKAGDFIWIEYMKRLFVVTNVDAESAIFLQKKFIYDIDTKAADISGEELMAGVNFENYETIQDVQNDNSALISAISGVVINKTNDRSIFGDYD